MSSVVLTIRGHLGNHPLLSLFVYYNFTLSWSILDVLRRFSNVDTLTETIHKSVLSYLRKQHLNRQCCNRMNHVTVPIYLMWKRNHQIIKWIQCTMGLNRFDLRVDMDSDPQHCSEHHISIVVTVRNLLPIGFWWQLQDPCKPHPGHEFSGKQTQVTLETNSRSASVWSFWVEERLFSSGLQKASTVPW